MLPAEELYSRGITALNAGRVHVASRWLEHAFQRTGSEDLRGCIQASLAYIAADLGDLTAGLALSEEARNRTSSGSSARGIVEGRRALLLMRAGRTKEALSSFDEAIQLLTDLPDHLGKALLNRGGVYLQQGAGPRADADFRRAAEYLQQAGLPVEAAMAKHNQGCAQLLQGDLVAALARMDEARAVLAPLSAVSAAICEQDRAEVLIGAGLVGEGQQALRDASRTYGRRRLRRRQAESEFALARTLAHAKPSDALVTARHASRLFVATGNDSWRVRADAVALAAEVELGRKSPALVARGAGLVEELRDQGLVWGSASVRLHVARVLVRRQDIQAARDQLGRVRLTEGAPLSLRLLARTVRAELATAQGRRAAAFLQIRQGLTDLHGWQSTFGSLDLQTGVVGLGRRLAIHGLELAVDSGSQRVLFEWSERARMLASRITPVRPPADEELAHDLAELRRLHAGSQEIRVPSPRRDADLRQRVRERAWQNKGSGTVTEPARLSAVREAIGRDTALVAWVVAKERLVALVVTNDSETVHPLGSFPVVRDQLRGLLPDLDVSASDLPPALTAVVRRELAARLDDLAEVLVAPLLEVIGDRRVVATPSGGLAGTPWTLLPGLVGRPVTVAQSATAWLRQRLEPLEVTTAGFVAGPRVVRAEAEVDAASRLWPGAERLTGEKANAEGVSRLAGGVDVLHIAAHGRHSADNPLFSGLELVDGPWFGYDIDHLSSVPQVVVLSACEVGRSSVRFGEELIGMTAAWLHAGARCVIASPSAVADEAAHDVLTQMHQQLARGLDPAAALAAAVPAVGEDAAPAPFVCFGAGW